MKAKSGYGEGSEFSSTVPVDVAQEPASEVPLSHGRLSDRRVLVVDDNATNRDILRAHLEHWGAEVSGAASGAIAIKQLDATALLGKKFDLLLIDYHMPVMDGLYFARRVTRTSLYSNPVMLMLSSVADEFAHSDMAACGISDYLTKPVLEDDLYQHICRALGYENELPCARRVAQNQEEESSPCGGLDILVAEDNVVNQELVQNAVGGIGG